MTKTWIDAIYDRTYESIRAVQFNPDQTAPKGCWNADDLNRIENNVAYCAEWMLEKKIVRVPPRIIPAAQPWENNVIPTKSEIDRILNNVRLLVDLSSTNPAIADRLPNIYAATQINYILANQIEFALELMHTQPKLPLEYWNLRLTHGIIRKIIRDGGTEEIINSSEALVAEDEIVTIMGAEYGEYAQYQTFTYWSGEEDDIGLLDNYQAKQTTFVMPYRDVSFTANFETHIPRTLTLTNGYISTAKDPTASSGPNTGTYFAGDEVMIIANVAPSGKRFYEWIGTSEALEHITGVTQSEDPSTAVLTMPDCDVNLEPHYINASKHLVTVSGGTGGGYYDYNENVTIEAVVPDHYKFTNWSGATSYLNNIYDKKQTFKMGDVNISFTANREYDYSYNSVQMIYGYIHLQDGNYERANNLRESSQYTLVPSPPSSGYGFDYWEIEGEGRVSTDSLGNQTHTFTVGDGNAIITGHYAPLRTLRVENRNNENETILQEIVQNHHTEVSTTEVVGDYIFSNWTMNGDPVSTSTTYRFDMPEEDSVIRANYRRREQVQVTVDYGNRTETLSMQERESRSITTNSTLNDYVFDKWTYSNLYYVSNVYNQTITIAASNVNGSVTANYVPPKNYYQLTVNAGATTGYYEANSRVAINANQAPNKYEFDHWEIISGPGTIDNIYSRYTTFNMGNAAAEITAHYRRIPTFHVNMIDGYILDEGTYVTEADLLAGATNEIKLKQGAVPSGHQFLQWEVYVNDVLQTDANDIFAPLAETTNLRGLSRDITIKATFFIPNTEVTYTLSIERKDGSSSQNEYPAGTNVNINASSPDQGMEFYKWTGDIAYVAGGVYNAQSYVHMPAQNIQIKENFVPEGYIPEFDVVMTTVHGECCYTTTSEDPDTHETIETEHWVERWSYPEGTTVKIRAVNISNEYYFSNWDAKEHETTVDARSVINNLTSVETTLLVPAYDIDVTPNLALKSTYELKVNDGGTSAYYYAGNRADVYFGKQSTEDVHYEFVRWTGSNVFKLELYDGGVFNVRTAGTEDNPQSIKMPSEYTELTPTYKSFYRLTLRNGTIDETETTQGYYEANTIVHITADPAPTGMKFQYWDGETSRIAGRYDPTTTITTASGTTDIRAVYSTDADRNDIGYVQSDLKETTTINNSDITIISGEIEPGFLLSDVNGHLYIITNVNTQTETSTIYRMTRITRGGNIYG